MISARTRVFTRAPFGIAISAISSRVAALFWPVGFAIVLFAVSTHSPIAEWGERNLSAHMMVQHLLNLIPGLILGRLAAPMVARWRPTIRLSTNIACILLAAVVLGIWHLPVTFEAAVHDTRVHALMHTSIFLLVGVPLGLSLRNLGGSARLLLFAASIPLSLLGTIVPYSATDLYPSYAPWQHAQMAWLMMVVMPLAGIAVLVIHGFWKPLTRLWSRYRLYEYGTICMASLLLAMLVLEITGLGHFHILH